MNRETSDSEVIALVVLMYIGFLFIAAMRFAGWI